MKEGGPSASPAGAGGARQNNSWQPSTSRAWQGEHGAKTWASSQAQARAVHRKPQHGRPSAQAGGLAGICSEHVSHGSGVAMEGIHQGKTARRRCRAKVSACVVPRSSCPLDAPRSACCPAALSASPLSPAPPPLCILHIFWHGTVRPRHPLFCITTPLDCFKQFESTFQFSAPP